MPDQITSPEVQAAAMDFNARREQDAHDWNERQRQNSGAAPAASSPMAADSSGHAALSESALHDAADSWRAPDAAPAATPDVEPAAKVISIESHPNFTRVENPPASADASTSEASVSVQAATEDSERYHGTPLNPVKSEVYDKILAEEDAAQASESRTEEPTAEHQDAVQEVGEVLAAEALTPVEAAQKSYDLMERLASQPEAFQQNAIDAVQLIEQLNAGHASREALSSVLLSQLQAEGRSVDLDSATGYLSALGSVDKMYLEMYKQDKLSQEEFDKIRATIDTRLAEVLQAKAHDINSRTSRPQPQPQARTATPVSATLTRTAPEVAPEATVAASPINAPETAPAQPEPTPSPEATDDEAAEKEKYYDEIGKANRRNAELMAKFKDIWNATPEASRRGLIGYDFRRLNELNGDIDAYSRDIEADMVAGKGRFESLKGDGLEKIAKRKQALGREIERITLEVERVKLESPEAVKGAEEYAKLQEKARKSSEKLSARAGELRERYPAFASLMDNDVRVKVEPARRNKPQKRPSVWGRMKGRA